MKLLRETIRNILFENKLNHWEKLATLLVSGDVANAIQAIELAESMEYIEDVTYRTEPWSNEFRNRMKHQWHFQADPGFRQTIEYLWQKGQRNNWSAEDGIWNCSLEFDYPKKGCVNLTIRENK